MAIVSYPDPIRFGYLGSENETTVWYVDLICYAANLIPRSHSVGALGGLIENETIPCGMWTGLAVWAIVVYW